MRHRLILCVMTLWPAAALAHEPVWSISEASGPVTVQRAGLSRVALRGGVIAPGDVVRTGAGGRAVLVRGQEYMMVAPGSQIRLPADAPQGQITQLVEEAGNVVFMIKKMAMPHFGVQTPYLAAVVKGTTFSVSVGDAGASVKVLEGKVDVATIDGGAHQMVLPGDSVSVGTRDLAAMNVVSNGRTRIVRSAAAKGALPAPGARDVVRPVAAPVAAATPNMIATTIAEPAVSIAALTDGLVNSGPATLVASSTTAAPVSSSLGVSASATPQGTQEAARQATVTVKQTQVALADAQIASAAAAQARASAEAAQAAAQQAAAQQAAAQQAAAQAASQAASAQAAAAAQQASQDAANQAAAAAAQQAAAAQAAQQQAAATAAAQQAAAAQAAQQQAAATAAAQQAAAAQAAQQAAAQQAAAQLAAQQAIAAQAAAAKAAADAAAQQAAAQAAAAQQAAALAAQQAAAQASAQATATATTQPQSLLGLLLLGLLQNNSAAGQSHGH